MCLNERQGDHLWYYWISGLFLLLVVLHIVVLLVILLALLRFDWLSSLCVHRQRMNVRQCGPQWRPGTIINVLCETRYQFRIVPPLPVSQRRVPLSRMLSAHFAVGRHHLHDGRFRFDVGPLLDDGVQLERREAATHRALRPQRDRSGRSACFTNRHISQIHTIDNASFIWPIDRPSCWIILFMPALFHYENLMSAIPNSGGNSAQLNANA